MTFFARGIAALALAATVSGAALAQDKTTLDTQREKASYMVGLDVGRSIEPAGPDMEVAAFQRALRNALDGKPALIADDKVQPLAQALMQRIAARSGKAPAGAGAPPQVARDQVGFLIGADVGRQLAPIQDEIDVPVLVQGVRTVLSNTKPLLSASEIDAVRTAFSKQMQAKMDAKATAEGARNKAEGEAFLAKNRMEKGVFTTGSGLQYMVLRQGNGPRPRPESTVRVNYRGSLLNGTEFDSSYARNAPAEFSLQQVIPGWTEGLALMPVGSKYRFWIPSEIGYGSKGAPSGGIGPNSVLVFDVELLAIPD